VAERALRFAALAVLVAALAACTSPRVPDRGERLAAACNGCHGPGGRGSGAIPALAGLEAGYLEQRLRDWQAAAEADGADHLMVRFARGLEPDDPSLLARHYAALPGEHPAP
jgi:cytochrome c553